MCVSVCWSVCVGALVCIQLRAQVVMGSSHVVSVVRGLGRHPPRSCRASARANVRARLGSEAALSKKPRARASAQSCVQMRARARAVDVRRTLPATAWPAGCGCGGCGRERCGDRIRTSPPGGRSRTAGGHRAGGQAFGAWAAHERGRWRAILRLGSEFMEFHRESRAEEGGAGLKRQAGLM